MDEKKIKDGVKLILEGIGEDRTREGLVDTPSRLFKMYKELFWGVEKDPADVVTVTFAEDHDEMVLVKDIPFHSFCEHHLMPFVGKAHVAYIPGKEGKITGISKLARVVEVASRKLQVQERLTTIVADSLVKALDPRGVLVLMEAEHFCMSIRGVSKPGTMTVTSAVRGIFLHNEATRAEAMSIIRG
ncbi:MAG: GTP cyclohydrolase I FolE [Terriglobia bacterium]